MIMKRQININIISNQIYNHFKDNDIDVKEYVLDSLNDFIEKYKSNINDEYYIIDLIESLFALSKEKNIDLNKYFPCFVEI